jgi:hypothetical protein
VVCVWVELVTGCGVSLKLQKSYSKGQLDKQPGSKISLSGDGSSMPLQGRCCGGTP